MKTIITATTITGPKLKKAGFNYSKKKDGYGGFFTIELKLKHNKYMKLRFEPSTGHLLLINVYGNLLRTVYFMEQIAAVYNSITDKKLKW